MNIENLEGVYKHIFDLSNNQHDITVIEVQQLLSSRATNSLQLVKILSDGQIH